MINERDIRENMISVLIGDMNIDDFYSWLEDESWNMHLDSSVSAQMLVTELEILFHEYMNGLAPEAHVVDGMMALVEHVTSIEPVDRVRRLEPDITGFSSYVSSRPSFPSRLLEPGLVPA